MISREHPRGRKPPLFLMAALMIFLISIAGSINGSDTKAPIEGSAQIPGNSHSDPGISRAENHRGNDTVLSQGDTMFSDDLDDGSNIAQMNGTILSAGSIVNDIQDPQMIHNTTIANIIPLGSDHHEITMLTFENSIFYMYSINAGTNKELFLVNSSDNGNSWSEPISIWKGKCDLIRASMAIWNGSIFIQFSPTDELSPNKNDMFVKQSSLEDISSISDADRIELKKGFVSDFQAIDAGNVLCVCLITSNSDSCLIYQFDGEDWSDSRQVIQNGQCDEFDLCVTENGPEKYLHINYINGVEINESTNDRTLMTMTSTDGGTSFSSPVNVTYLNENVSNIHCAVIDGEMAILYNEPGENSILCSISSDDGGNWSVIEIDLYLEAHEQAIGGVYDFAVSVHGSRLFINFLSGSGDLYFTCSNYHFTPWVLRTDPLLINDRILEFTPLGSSQDLLFYYTMINDEVSIQIERVGSYEPIGSMEFVEISPPSLGSWEDVGIKAEIPEGTEIGLMIMDGENLSRTFPEAGWLNLSDFNEGEIHGGQFDHIIVLNESWIMTDVPRSLSLKFILLGNGGITPRIDGIALNYTTSFPFIEDLSTSLHIKEMDASFEPGAIKMLAGENIQYFKMDPIEKETGSWPDHIALNITGMGSGDDVYIGLIDPVSGEYIGGRSTQDCQLRNGFKDENRYIPFWNGSCFGALSDEVHAVELHVLMFSDHGTGKISINEIRSLDDLPPQHLQGSMGHEGAIRRTETLQIESVICDDIQKPEDLDVKLESLGPEGIDLPDSTSITKEYMDDGWKWTLIISPDCPLGIWQFSVMISDMTLDHGSMITQIGELEVVNNIPTPPSIEFQSLEVGTDDDITASVVNPGFDEETLPDDLRYSYEWLLDGRPFSKIENTTMDLSTISHDLTSKDQSWTVKVTCSDGIDSSSPIFGTINVSNTGPRIKEDSEFSMSIEEDSTDNLLEPGKFFEDIDNDTLLFDIVPGPFINFTRVGGEIYLVPDPDWNGITEVSIEASDDEYSLNCSIEILVTPINDPPENVKIIEPASNTSRNGSSVWNFTGSYIDRDSDYGQGISCYWEVDGISIGEGLELKNIKLNAGAHIVSFIVSDGEFPAVNRSIKIIVLEKVDVPEIIIDNEEPDNKEENITESEIDDEEPSGLLPYIMTFSVIALIIMTVIGCVALILSHRVGENNNGFNAAPISSVTKKEPSEDPNTICFHDDDQQLHLPSIEEPGKASNDGINIFKPDTWGKRKAMRTCISQNGQRVEDKRTSRDKGFYPYSFRNNGAERMAPLDDPRSFYIRPESPYRRR